MHPLCTPLTRTSFSKPRTCPNLSIFMFSIWRYGLFKKWFDNDRIGVSYGCFNRISNSRYYYSTNLIGISVIKMVLYYAFANSSSLRLMATALTMNLWNTTLHKCSTWSRTDFLLDLISARMFKSEGEKPELLKHVLSFNI